MPIVANPRNDLVKRQREALLRSQHHEQEPKKNVVEVSPQEFSSALDRMAESADAERNERMADYRAMVSDTGTIPLQKLAFTASGVSLFDELCLRVDVNQRYADCLPQWGDLARELEVDELKSRWVGACVRPSEGLTRAVLEMYSADGGTLGEVLGAMLRMEMLQTLEEIKPKVRAFLKEREVEGGGNSQRNTVDASYFSLLSTLAKAFGPGDPCFAIQKFSVGLKNYALQQQQQQQQATTTVAFSEVQTHDLALKGSGAPQDNKDPPPALLFDPLRHSRSNWDLSEKDKSDSRVCRILLIFASDGAGTADVAYRKLQGFQYEGVRAEVFRLSETSLWYEVLVNPEACCMKWVNEADYVMPVLTEGFLQQIHLKQQDGEEDGVLPTSPVLNRFMYTLLRARYAAAGCRNTMVRPVIPRGLSSRVGQSKAVKLDPLFRLAWVTDAEDRLEAKARGMLAEVAKKTASSSA